MEIQNSCAQFFLQMWHSFVHIQGLALESDAFLKFVKNLLSQIKWNLVQPWADLDILGQLWKK